jgi:transposase-like protein
MAKHRTYSIEFKRQVAQEFLAGETLHGLSKRHDVCRNLIRVWVQKHQAGAFDDEVETANLLQQYEARIAALERLVGKQALELEFQKGTAHPGREAGVPPSLPALWPQYRRRMPADGNCSLGILRTSGPYARRHRDPPSSNPMIRNARRCPADGACNNARSIEANLYVPGVGPIWLQFNRVYKMDEGNCSLRAARPAERLVSDSRVFDYSCAFGEIDGLIGNSSTVGNRRSKESRHDECDCGCRRAAKP